MNEVLRLVLILFGLLAGCLSFYWLAALMADPAVLSVAYHNGTIVFPVAGLVGGIASARAALRLASKPPK